MSDKATVLRITLKGKPSSLAPLSVTVLREIGRIPMARLTFSAFAEDGDFAAACEPGTEIGIEGQLGETWLPLFSGLVSGQSFAARNGGRWFTIEARDKAQILTLCPRTRCFEKKKDSEICAAIIQANGLSASVEATAEKHEQLVQFRTTDWDFIMHRLWANGLVALVKDGKISGVKPEARGAALALTPDEVLDLESRVEARAPAADVSAMGWDPAKQEAFCVKGKAANVAVPGRLGAKKAAAILDAGTTLPCAGGASKEELRGWASGLLTRGRLALCQGRARVSGREAEPGGKLEFRECGTAVDGEALIWGVRHSFADGAWLTEIQFGTAPLDAAAELWSRPLPGFAGLWPGTVQKISADPEKGCRIRVRLPSLHEQDKDGLWARLAAPDAGDGRGMVFRPEKGDEVLVGFYDGDPRFPVVVGQMFSKARPAPEAIPATDEKNHIKGLVTRSGIRLLFDDDNKAVTLQTPGGNLLEIHDKNKSATLKDQHGNSLTLEKDGIILDSTKNITLRAKGDVKISATGDITLDGKGAVGLKAARNLKAEGLSVELKGTTTLKAEAANTTLSGSALTTVKGALVKIN